MSTRLSTRRPSKAEIEAAIKWSRDCCTICSRKLRHLEVRASGYRAGNPRLELAGICCSDQLHLVHGYTLFYAPDLKDELPGR